jgi:hypothetical protein
LHAISPPALLDTQVGVDACIARCASQVLILSIGNVDVALGVTILLGKTKVNDMHLQQIMSNRSLSHLTLLAVTEQHSAAPCQLQASPP